jgi:hypothetical protein
MLKKHMQEDPSSDVGGEEERAAVAATLGHAQDAAGEGVDQPMSETPANLAPANAEATNTPTADPSESQSPRKQNAQALKHVVTQIPAALAPLFQGPLLRSGHKPLLTLIPSYCEIIHHQSTTNARRIVQVTHPRVWLSHCGCPSPTR